MPVREKLFNQENRVDDTGKFKPFERSNVTYRYVNTKNGYTAYREYNKGALQGGCVPNFVRKEVVLDKEGNIVSTDIKSFWEVLQ